MVSSQSCGGTVRGQREKKTKTDRQWEGGSECVSLGEERRSSWPFVKTSRQKRYKSEEAARGDRLWQDSPWPARSEAGERYMDTGGWWCLGPWRPCGWSGRGRAGGKGAPGVGDSRWRSEEEEEEPQAEPSTIHPTARSSIQNSWPSWGFPLGSMAHAPLPF